MNKIAPGTIQNYNTNSKIAFKNIENIENYLKVTHKFGIATRDQFMTIDLYEGKGMLVVLRNLQKLQKAHEQHGIKLKDLVKEGKLIPAEVLAKMKEKKPTTWSTTPSPIITATVVKEPENTKPAEVSSLNTDITTIQSFKYDPTLEKQARKWIEVLIFI